MQHIDRSQFAPGLEVLLQSDQRLMLSEVLGWASITIYSSDQAALGLWVAEPIGEGRFRSNAMLVLPEANNSLIPLAEARRVDSATYLSLGDLGVRDSFSCVAFGEGERLGTLRIPRIGSIALQRHPLEPR